MLKIEKNKNYGKDDYAGIKFVLSAMSKDNTRRVMKDHVFFDGACFWATDGERLHYYYYKDNTIEPGTWEVICKDAKTIVLDKSEAIFPNIFCLGIFKKDPSWELRVSTAGDKYGNHNKSQGYAKIVRNMPEDVTIDYRYFDALPEDNYSVYGTEKTEPICFANHDKGAAIMPMRVI